MMVALDAGAEDIVEYEDSFDVLCAPDVFNDVVKAVKDAGLEVMEADIEQVPSMTSTPDDSQLGSLRKMIETLEDDDDVQKVYTNCGVDLYGEE